MNGTVALNGFKQLKLVFPGNNAHVKGPVAGNLRSPMMPVISFGFTIVQLNFIEYIGRFLLLSERVPNIVCFYSVLSCVRTGNRKRPI